MIIKKTPLTPTPRPTTTNKQQTLTSPPITAIPLPDSSGNNKITRTLRTFIQEHRPNIFSVDLRHRLIATVQGFFSSGLRATLPLRREVSSCGSPSHCQGRGLAYSFICLIAYFIYFRSVAVIVLGVITCSVVIIFLHNYYYNCCCCCVFFSFLLFCCYSFYFYTYCVLHTYIHICIQAYIHTYLHTLPSIHTYKTSESVFIYTCVCVCIHVPTQRKRNSHLFLGVFQKYTNKALRLGNFPFGKVGKIFGIFKCYFNHAYKMSLRPKHKQNLPRFQIPPAYIETFLCRVNNM